MVKKLYKTFLVLQAIQKPSTNPTNTKLLLIMHLHLHEFRVFHKSRLNLMKTVDQICHLYCVATVHSAGSTNRKIIFLPP